MTISQSKSIIEGIYFVSGTHYTGKYGMSSCGLKELDSKRVTIKLTNKTTCVLSYTHDIFYCFYLLSIQSHVAISYECSLYIIDQ